MTIAPIVAALREKLWPFVHRSEADALRAGLDEAEARNGRLRHNLEIEVELHAKAREECGKLAARLAAAEAKVGRIEDECNRLVEDKARLTRAVADARKALG